MYIDIVIVGSALFAFCIFKADLCYEIKYDFICYTRLFS